MSTGTPSSTAQAQKSAEMSTSASSSGSDLGIESTDIKTATGVSLSPQQRVLVGSVLDVLLPIHLPRSEQGWKGEEERVLTIGQLFAGKPTLKKLQLWTDDATFADPLTKAEGRRQYEAQWYGLKAAFSEIVCYPSPSFSPP
jgi:hypothetical protein